MALYVDPPNWQWRGLWWCHLISDHSVGELHAFAHELGVPPPGFQGDHYDIHADARTAAVALGAIPVSSRHLVQRLYASGLRVPPAERVG